MLWVCRRIISPARKKALLMHFGTAKAVRGASLEDLQKAPGVSAAVAQQVYDFYHSRRLRSLNHRLARRAINCSLGPV